MLTLSPQTEAHRHYRPFPVTHRVYCPEQEIFLVLKLDVTVYKVWITAEYVGKQKLVPVPVNVERLVD